MATRIKTIEYAFQSRNTSLAAATRHDFTGITINIPETIVAFRSVRVVVGCRDTATTATSLTSPLVGIKIGAVAFSDATLGNPPGNTGESGHYIFERDVTSYFTTNWSGTSQTVQVGVQFSGVATINQTAKIYITYEYDDTASTQIKTVRIPIESGVGALTATLAQIGTNQIPALDTFLPEASKTYRCIWIEAIYNESTVGTANDSALGMQVASGTEHLTGVHESGLASSCSGWYVWDQGATPAWSTASAQAFNARGSTITTSSTWNHVAFVLHVTYEFNVSSSSTIINSLVLVLPPIPIPGATASTDENINSIDLYIEEPATITQVQSGALVWYSQAAAVGPNIAFGAQSQRAYTDVSLLFCGASFLTQRTDSGGAQGSAWTLARGKNTLKWQVRIGTAGINPSGFGGLLYLNYTSGKSSLGPGAHNQSLLFNVQNSQASGNNSIISAAQMLYIPETDWFRNQLAFLTNNVMGVTSSLNGGVTFEVESASGELNGQGFEVQGVLLTVTEAELGWYPQASGTALQNPLDWARWNGDPDTVRMSLTASRRWRVNSIQTGTRPLSVWLTKHGITFTVSGNITGSAGGTVNINLCRASDGAILKSTSRVGNGSFSITWLDNTENVYIDARESGTALGRSDNGVAT